MVRDGHRRNDCLDGLLGRSMNRNTLFFGTLGLFLLYQGAIAMGWMVAWADSYLDPLLFVPVALGAPGWLIRQWKVDFRWNVFFITGAWLAASLAFELWIPSFDPRFTADGWDVLCYALGAEIFRWSE